MQIPDFTWPDGADALGATLTQIVTIADACNLFPSPDLPRKLAVLREHCAAEGRDYDTIEKTCIVRYDVGADGSNVGALLGQLRGLADLGIQTVIGSVADMHRITPLEVIGREVIPVIADL